MSAPSSSSSGAVTRYNLFDLKPAFFTALVAAVRRIEDGSHKLAVTPQQAVALSTAPATATSSDGAASVAAEAVTSATATALALTSAAVDASKREEDSYPCATCGGAASHAVFANVHEYRAHCKTAWHRHNVKSQASAKPGTKPLSEEEYSEFAADHDDAEEDVDVDDDGGDAAADSKAAKKTHRRKGSKPSAAEADHKADGGGAEDDGEPDEDMPPPDDEDRGSGGGGGGHHSAPRILFFTNVRIRAQPLTGAADSGKHAEPEHHSAGAKAALAAAQEADAHEHVVTVWKNLLHHARPPSLLEYAMALRALHTQRKWFIFIAHGGRFAGGVFVGDKCVIHKSISRYTVRRKQGGSQAARDNSGGPVGKSMGSQIRRAQTVKFKEDIVTLQADWAEHLQSAHRMFLYTPSTNRQYFFHPTCAIAKTDPRVCSIPFAVRRPIFAEVQRVHKWLSTIEIAPAAAVASAASASGAADAVDLKSGKRTASKSPVKDAKALEAAAVAAADAERDAALAGGTSAKGSAANVPLPPDDLLLRAIRDGDLPSIAALRAAKYVRPPPSTKYPIYPAIYFATALGRLAAVRVLLGLPATAPGAAPAATPSSGASAGSAAAVAASAPSASTASAGGAEAKAVAAATDETEEDLSGVTAEFEGDGAGAIDEPTPEWYGRTALHRAANDGAPDLVSLLLRAGADPTASGSGGKSQTAYQLASDKRTRQVFSDFAAANPDAWEWSAAHVPVKDEGAAKAAADKKRAKKKAQREKEKTKKQAAAKAKEEATIAEAKQKASDAARLELLKASLERDSKVSTLSDREKRAQAAELRLLAMKGSGAKCDHCAKPLLRVPFERLQYKYDTIACLQAHKAALEAAGAPAPKKI